MTMNKGIKLTALALLTFSTAAYAGWPIFNTLTPLEISKLSISNDCPKGEVRVPANTKVPIEIYKFHEQWYWESPQGSECFKPAELNYLSIEQTSNEAPGVIKANYGTKQTRPFSFIFHIPARPWDCGYFMGPKIPNEIGCAQDQ